MTGPAEAAPTGPDEQHFPDGGGRLHAGPRAGCWLCEPSRRAPTGVGDGLPDDAVEAAARALRMAEWRDDRWDETTDDEQRYWRGQALAALAAALPAIRRHIADQIRDIPLSYLASETRAAPMTAWQMRAEAERVARGGETDG